MVGRVRTHGQTYFRGKLGEAGAGAITETSSKEDIIKHLHRMVQH